MAVNRRLVKTTMVTGIVLFALRGISVVPVARLERYTHALAGATVLLCGISIRFLGL